MAKKLYPPSVSHDENMVELFRTKPELAVECLRVAVEEATDEEGRFVLLQAIRQIAEARGIGKVAKAAGIPRETLSRALSAKGNPRFDTLFAVTHAMGLQITLQPTSPIH